MTSLPHVLILLGAVVTHSCLAILEIQPVSDDLEDRSDYYRNNYYSPHYANEKRSFIYPQYDVEKFALVPEAARDDKRDSIKGPSIDPIIQENDSLDVDEEGMVEGRALQTPNVPIEENGRKLSEIAKEDGVEVKRRHKKISEKEKEAISAGLIKLLYDWKLHKAHASSGSGSKEGTNSQQISGDAAEEIEGIDGQRKHASSRHASGKNSDLASAYQKTKAMESNQDPLSESKDNPAVMTSGNKAKGDHAWQEESPEEDEGSTEVTKRKSKGKINVLVNVNINERSLRSKVSRANKNKRRRKLSRSARNDDAKASQSKDEEINENLVGEADDEEDDDDDGDGNADETPEKANMASANSSASQTYNDSSTVQTAYKAQNFRPLPAALTDSNALSSQPNAQQQNTYADARPENSYSKDYYSNYQTSSATMKTTPPQQQAVSSETEDESSGDEEYDSLQERIEADGASGYSGSHDGEEEVKTPKPQRTSTRKNEQRNAQIYLPGSMQTVTEKHEKKGGKEEDETFDDQDQAPLEDKENEEKGSEKEKQKQQEAVAPTANISNKKYHHRNHRKTHKSVKKLEDRAPEESFAELSKAKEKSTATPKYSKPKENPKFVTKSSDNVGKLERPQEATTDAVSNKGTKMTEKLGAERKEATVETEGLEKYGTLRNVALGKASDTKVASSEDTESVHFVKLHDSEIQLLKEHRARVQSSEPIVIDDIKKKHEKPKANPKEATKQSETETKVDKSVKQNAKAPEENEAAFKPTAKRNALAVQKPEAVIPFKQETKDQEKSKEKIAEEGKKDTENDAKVKAIEKGGLGDEVPKKYGSLKSVRARFKAWEKEMISRLSNPFLSNDVTDNGSGEVKQHDKSYQSWTDEEKALISKLSNPFLPKKVPAKGNKLPKERETKNTDEGKDEKESGNKDVTKDATKNEDIVKDHLRKNIEAEKSTATPIKNNEMSSEMPIAKSEAHGSQKEEEVVPSKNVVQSFVPGKEEKEEKDAKAEEPEKKRNEKKDVDLKQLEKFREQITAEVGKINKLEEEYKKNLMESKELKNAKQTLTKDLKYIQEIETKLTKDSGKSDGESNAEADKKPFVGKKMDPDEKKISKPTNGKQDPLVMIQGLLKAEILRSKNKEKKGDDQQLENIRGLLKQELKKLIKSGKLGSPESLPTGLKKLGKMIHQKLKDAKKKKRGKKKHKKNSKKKAVHGKDLKNSLDLVKEYKPTVAGSNRGYITTMSKYKAAMEALKTLKEQQEAASLQSNLKEINSTEPTKPHVVMPKNLPTGAQAEQFKDLLKNLNKKIGEVYSRLQSTTQRQQGPEASANTQQGPPSNANHANDANSANTANSANSFMPPQGNGNYNARPTDSAVNPVAPPQANDVVPQSAVPITSSFNEPQPKHDTPIEPEPKEEPEPDTVLAEAEPVETLIENLEKDITDVWSFKEQYPDAVSLGLDNDKIHKTYANLGSISGLNLRRSLERALRGRDVGLVIVGGSISKGGPFSEKGVDYALKTYFYAIADWWNKVIRPITGSGMVIRDVSIGGIATDYYSYCLRSHLPDDKMTNIVLWELSANDMHRYDDVMKPKQQSLEQFTQEVLSFKAKPALIYLNFFALFSWNQDLSTHCRNFEDEGESEIAKHYKITSLSWRDMVCSLMQENAPLFTRDELFSEDKFHPSIEAHAQMAYIIIDYIRTEFLKNLVKQRFLEIGDAARKLKIPETVYVPKPMYKQTFTWKPLCYTYMIVDNKEPNNTLSIKEEVNGDFQYTILREFKIRSDKIIGMETKKADQYITYEINVPVHRNGETAPYKSLAIMSFTDDRQAEVRLDNSPVQRIDTAKKFLEGTVLKYIATNVTPGNHKLTIRSGPNGFIISAVMLG